MKVLIAAHTGFPVGGISINYEMLLKSNLAKKVDLSFVETSRGGMDFTKRGKTGLKNILNAIQNIGSFMVQVWRVRPDIVHLGSASGTSLLKHALMAWLARLAGAKVEIQLHFSLQKLPRKGALARFYRLTFRICNAITVISTEWFELSKIDPKIRVFYIPNAIDTKNFPEAQSGQGGDPMLLYIGHLGRDKGTYDLLSAVHLLKTSPNLKMASRFSLVLHGESLSNGEDQLIQDEILRLDLADTVKICPPVYGEEKLRVMGSAAVVVLPSYHEGMPMSILEAMAMGLPVVATSVGGIPDQVVNRETGLLIPPGDPQALARALKELLEDELFRADLGRAARKRAVEVFDIERKVDSLTDLYTSIYAE